MKKRGLTLVELVATLVVLGVIATIVFPNIFEAIADYRKGMYEVQLETIIGATKDWAANNYSKLQIEDGEEVYVLLSELQEGGYIDDPLKNNSNGKEFNKNTFVIIKCHEIAADDNNESNFTYTYEVYDTNEKHLILLAEKWVNDRTINKDTTLQLSQLIDYANLKVDSSKLKNIEDGTLINNATVKVTYSEGVYTYKVESIG